MVWKTYFHVTMNGIVCLLEDLNIQKLHKTEVSALFKIEAHPVCLWTHSEGPHVSHCLSAYHLTWKATLRNLQRLPTPKHFSQPFRNPLFTIAFPFESFNQTFCLL